MQTLFAFGQCVEANYNIGLADIDEVFKPDLNSMEAPNHELLDQNKVLLEMVNQQNQSQF